MQVLISSFRRLLAVPMHRGSIVAGKMLAYMAVLGLQVRVLFTPGNAFGMALGLLIITLALPVRIILPGSQFYPTRTSGMVAQVGRAPDIYIYAQIIMAIGIAVRLMLA